MAHSPKRGGALRGVVKPPNEAGPGGNRARNSYLPLDGTTGPRLACDHGGGDRRHGCVPLDGIASPVHPTCHRFDVETSKMPQPPSEIEPGKGAIPVSPWDAAGRPNRAAADLEILREPGR
jgi:hypothetical protein